MISDNDHNMSMSIIKRVKDSACGPDGIPYSVYSACTETSSTIILENTTEYFSSAEEVSGLDKFIMQFVCFPPKGELEEDSTALISLTELQAFFVRSSAPIRIASLLPVVLPTLFLLPRLLSLLLAKEVFAVAVSSL